MGCHIKDTVYLYTGRFVVFYESFLQNLLKKSKAKRTTIDGLLLLKFSPEDEGWVLPGLGGVHLVGPVVLRDRDLHELEHN